MTLSIEFLTLVIGVSALLGPGLLYLGLKIGALTTSTKSAHARIDKLEILLREEFRALRGDLKDAIANAWRNCPVAHEHSQPGDSGEHR